MFVESGAPAKNCIWSATLTQRLQAKEIVVKLERRCHDKTQDRSTRPAQHELSRFARNGHRRSPTLRTDSAILDLGRMRDNAPHITEG
jgi:hypothetical protein